MVFLRFLIPVVWCQFLKKQPLILVLLRIIDQLLYLLFELIVYPWDISICNNQFDFRSDFSVYNGTSLLNNVMCNSKYTGSNIFICSLDTEKCFDYMAQQFIL